MRCLEWLLLAFYWPAGSGRGVAKARQRMDQLLNEEIKEYFKR